ncbi:MAG: beta-propeller fold lactonase family protein [Proteobacteria bacterium]|nr:beta-propeller fold lactonase family protein [Pseudomonadota bacterium]
MGIYKQVYSLILLILFSLYVVSVQANDSRPVGAVFVATNPDPTTGNNGIMMYLRAKDGTLTLAAGSPFLTQGKGTGLGYIVPPDALGSQGSLAVDKLNRFLFVVNAGSNQISVFKISRSGLTHIETVDSGGDFPNSIAVRNNILYVLNAAGNSNFKAFYITLSGHLKPIPGASCDLQPPLNYWPVIFSGHPQETAMPGQIGFTPSGDKLVIIRKEGLTEPNPFGPLAGPGRIDVYQLGFLGLPVCSNPTANINDRIPAGRFPFAFDFDDNGHLMVVEIFGSPSYDVSPFNAGAMSSYNVKNNGVLKVLTASLPNNQTAICWIKHAGNFVYASNNFSDSISLYKVDNKGSLSLLNYQAAIVGTPSNPSGFPLDLDITKDGRFLYQLVPGQGLVYAFSINKQTGALTQIGTASAGVPFTGQVGLTTADFGDK